MFSCLNFYNIDVTNMAATVCHQIGLKKEVIISKKTNTNHLKQKAEHDAKMLELFL